MTPFIVCPVFGSGSLEKKMPKIEPTSSPIIQIISMIATATQPPAAIAATSPFIAAMAAFTSAATALAVA
jgi:hypothetical protein